MLTGELPFNGDGAVDIAMKQVSDQPPSLRSRDRLVTPELEQVVMRALAKDPALRHSSARAMADELRRVRGAVAVSADHAAGDPGDLGPAGGRHRGRSRRRRRRRRRRTQAQPAAVAPGGAVPGGCRRYRTGLCYKQLQGNQVTVPQDLAGDTCAAAQAKLTRLG